MASAAAVVIVAIVVVGPLINANFMRKDLVLSSC